LTTASAANVLSRDDIVSAVRAFTRADWIRLGKVAQRYSAGRMEADDLLQEAFTRALDTRSCPSHVTVVKFIAEAMRSIANAEGQKVENKVALVSVAKTGEKEPEAYNIVDPQPDAEAQLVSAEQAEFRREAIFVLFEDDPVARDIVEGTLEGMVGRELRELTGLDETAYNSKRRLIRRRIEKAFPQRRLQ
jgi:RNA polymerase sigma-70 factor (ECF subfamily)